jgi:hypothetical protein
MSKVRNGAPLRQRVRVDGLVDAPPGRSVPPGDRPNHSVSVVPGATAFTRILHSAKSAAIV